ncbi:hypothetical protein J6590_107094, partial [Homalodisca vitripennis]
APHSCGGGQWCGDDVAYGQSGDAAAENRQPPVFGADASGGCGRAETDGQQRGHCYQQRQDADTECHAPQTA